MSIGGPHEVLPPHGWPSGTASRRARPTMRRRSSPACVRICATVGVRRTGRCPMPRRTTGSPVCSSTWIWATSRRHRQHRCLGARRGLAAGVEGARHQVRCFGRSARKVDCTDGFGWDVGRPPRHAPANAERSAGPVSESQVSCKLRAPCGTGGPSSHCWRWSTCRSRPPRPSTLEMEAPANPLHQSANRASIAIASPPPSYTASWDGSGKIPHEWGPDIPDTPEPNPFRRARPGQRLRECSPLHVPPSQRRAAARKTALGLGSNHPRLRPLRRSRVRRPWWIR